MDQEKNNPKEQELLEALSNYTGALDKTLNDKEKEFYEDYLNDNITSDNYEVVDTHEFMGQTYQNVKRIDEIKKEDASIARIREKINNLRK